METIAFRMNLNRGQAEEYRRRHDEIWPELAALLKEAGARDYHTMDRLPQEAIIRKWWDYMADIMAVEADNTPVQVPLVKMFDLE
jgi:L-rhamnose mutarotase